MEQTSQNLVSVVLLMKHNEHAHQSQELDGYNVSTMCGIKKLSRVCMGMAELNIVAVWGTHRSEGYSRGHLSEWCFGGIRKLSLDLQSSLDADWDLWIRMTQSGESIQLSMFTNSHSALELWYTMMQF